MNTLASIHWVGTLVGGFLAEVSLFQHALLYVAPVGSLATNFAFAIWVGRRLDQDSSCSNA